MDKSEQMEMMKLRVLRSFKWNAQIVHPLAQEFGIEDEEFEEILMNHFDMSYLENIHATFEIAEKDRLFRRIYIDLRFHWFCDVLELVSPEDAEAISIKAAEEVWNGKDYEEALKTGREEILELIKLIYAQIKV